MTEDELFDLLGSEGEGFERPSPQEDSNSSPPKPEAEASGADSSTSESLRKSVMKAASLLEMVSIQPSGPQDRRPLLVALARAKLMEAL